MMKAKPKKKVKKKRKVGADATAAASSKRPKLEQVPPFSVCHAGVPVVSDRRLSDRAHSTSRRRPNNTRSRARVH